MNCVCKVLIYYPPKTEHPIMIWRCCSRSWILWGCALHEVKHKHSWMNDFSISNIKMAFRKVKDLIGETCCTLRIVLWFENASVTSTCCLVPWCSFSPATHWMKFWDMRTIGLAPSFQKHQFARESWRFSPSADHCCVIQSLSLHSCMQRVVFASEAQNEILRHANCLPWA